MENLQEKFYRRLQSVSLDFVRSEIDDIAWESRLIGVRGARGVGKTTLLLQYIKSKLTPNHETLYVNLDNLYFSTHTLGNLIDLFVKRGGKHLFLDEVHKYENWAQEIKNAYDDYPDLQIVFTGSSLLEILKARADLSRRAVVYELQGLSYRSFLNLILGISFMHYSLSDILENHLSIAHEINSAIKPLQYFGDYLEYGYYPFFLEGKNTYALRLEEIVNLILEIELPLLRKVDPANVSKLKQLLKIIAEAVPFVPNVSKLSARIGITRNTFVTYLYYLQEARLTRNLYKNAKGITQLQKPDKIFLENTNLQHTLSFQKTSIGSIRESFFANQVGYQHFIEYPSKGDFLVDEKYTFEIGGINKTKKQISGVRNAFVVKDDIEYGSNQVIPLWLFGFLY